MTTESPLNTTKCPHCGKIVDDRVPACPDCGTKIYVEHPADITPIRNPPESGVRKPTKNPTESGDR